MHCPQGQTRPHELYRRWPSKRHLVAYSVLSEMGENPAADTGSLRDDSRRRSGRYCTHSQDRWAGARGAVADMAQDTELADIMRQQVLAARRESMREAFARAKARCEIRDDLQMEVMLDMLTGPFYFRALFWHAPMSRA